VPVFRASGAPLAYMWPPGASAEPYLGAAHGLIGILYALLLLQQAAPQCMPNAAADLTDIRAALGCVGMLLAWRGVHCCLLLSAPLCVLLSYTGWAEAKCLFRLIHADLPGHTVCESNCSPADLQVCAEL
jgi:hypothetical protein